MKVPPPGLAPLPSIPEWVAEYLDAGNTQAASGKLERISPVFRSHPDVLEMQCKIFQQEKRWRAALDTARKYSQAAPEKVNGWIAQAVCLHEMDLTQTALDTLTRSK